VTCKHSVLHRFTSFFVFLSILFDGFLPLLPPSLQQIMSELFFFWDHSSGGVQICCCGVTAEREIRSNDYVPNHGVHLRQSVSYVCGAVCHALSLSRSLSLCHLQPTPLYCTHHYAYTYLAMLLWSCSSCCC